MNIKHLSPLLPLLVLGSIATLRADDSTDAPVPKPDVSVHRIVVRSDHDDDKPAKTPVTFLGVETASIGAAFASQLGLPADTGLVVVHVAEESPAAAGLKRHDVLTKLDDQILVDTRQLSVLVRSHKEGEEIALTLYRGGKEQVVKVKLGKRELPRMIGMGNFRPGAEHSFEIFNDDDQPDGARLRELPGLARDDVDNVLHMIGREHGRWFGAPGMRVLNLEGGKGSTVLDLAEGNFVFSDESGSVEVNAGNGKRELAVKNPKGEVTFKGPINDEADRKKLPPEVVARLNKIEKMDVSYEPGEDFEQNATAIRPPDKTKIKLDLAPAVSREPVLSDRAF